MLVADINMLVLQISVTWSYTPLNDTADAASQVIKALAERGWTIHT